jgi:hypothetical protein
MSSKTTVLVRRRTIPARPPPLNGPCGNMGIDSSRRKNRNLLSRYPEIKAYLESSLEPFMLETRKTVHAPANYQKPNSITSLGHSLWNNSTLDSCYIVPALNRKTQYTYVKYIFGMSINDTVPPAPWTSIAHTDWYVIDAACQSEWDISSRVRMLTGVDCISSLELENNIQVLTACKNILYFQYHLYNCDSQLGRCYRFCS